LLAWGLVFVCLRVIGFGPDDLDTAGLEGSTAFFIVFLGIVVSPVLIFQG